MKKTLKIAGYALLAVLCGAVLFAAAYYHYYDRYFLLAAQLELLCYGVWWIGFMIVFFQITKRMKRLTAKLILAGGTALVFSVLLVLANNLFRLLRLMQAFPFDSFSYLQILTEDITYVYNHGFMRYPAVFLVSFLSYAALAVVMHPSVQRWADEQQIRFERWLTIRKVSKMSHKELYNMMDRLDEEVKKAVLPPIQKVKDDLKAMVDEEPSELYLHALFGTCGPILTREEYLHYRTLWLDLQQKEIDRQRAYFNTAKPQMPDYCQALEQKFGMEESE